MIWSFPFIVAAVAMASHNSGVLQVPLAPPGEGMAQQFEIITVDASSEAPLVLVVRPT
jgi:hypothetical protein